MSCWTSRPTKCRYEPDLQSVIFIVVIYLLIPIALIIVIMMLGVPVMHAALYGILSCIVVGIINPDVKFGIREAVDALVDGARTALAVVAATACAGIIVRVGKKMHRRTPEGVLFQSRDSKTLGNPS